MAETTQFELVSPEKLLYSEAAEMVVVPGTEGYFGVLPRHAPMISTLEPGVIDIYQNGSVAERIFVAGGFAEVTETRCTVLAEEAQVLKDVDTAKVESDLADLRDDLKDVKTDLERERTEQRIKTLEALRAAAAN
ncbi:F0F1 ATP synthase subunit epsilon [uncultured Nisaea sp.]|jgi:F-type H+-transporting ATPase subunit epsilon|uniref:F0F1 ATP synthase subunit epsilon n=1 Tax=uncultured Nisaea sp. TaxID=538215 RepID=UPI0030ED4B9D|tara:strand:+ start:2133 stop:2537 length:405 start_codon:yes stop_codon:yes gene_type:complete